MFPLDWPVCEIKKRRDDSSPLGRIFDRQSVVGRDVGHGKDEDGLEPIEGNNEFLGFVDGGQDALAKVAAGAVAALIAPITNAIGK